MSYEPQRNCGTLGITVLSVFIIIIAIGSITSVALIVHFRAEMLRPHIECDAAKITAETQQAYAEVAYLVHGFKADFVWYVWSWLLRYD